MLTNEELSSITGGASGLSATLFNSLARLVTVILDFGRSIGTSISRIRNRNYCN